MPYMTLFVIKTHRCFETNLVWSMRGSLEVRKLGRRAGRAALSANCLQADRHARGRLDSTDLTRLNILPEQDPRSRRRQTEWNNRNLKKRSS
jgi:hypothetical protein